MLYVQSIYTLTVKSKLNWTVSVEKFAFLSCEMFFLGITQRMANWLTFFRFEYSIAVC